MDSRRRARISSSSLTIARASLLFCFRQHPKNTPKRKTSPTTTPIAAMACSLNPWEEEEEEEEEGYR